MENQLRKVTRYLSLLRAHRWENETKITGIRICPCGYKRDNTPPDDADFVPYESGARWGSGKDSHAWFRFPASEVSADTYLCLETDREGWDASNPQFLVYVDGEIRQGLDTNHREVFVGDASGAQIDVYAYTGPEIESARLYARYRTLSREVNGLFYDLLYPHQLLDCTATDSPVYAQILYHLYRAVSMLELYDVGSEDFRASVTRAREYLRTEFYGRYCGASVATAVCIGHTHIDCAWKWTLEQTREKVQRSFSTVLELMRAYPEYKFMSSQAFLYQNLKEEAPEVYRRVADRIREGRWECEGAMWVEADCNLTSGESLVRQILYGKRFFREEFGVENRVLWLPDVFGYSAALPQILRKSGVDWFVTSKISWNDVNQMPYDTFRWKGIDGTAVNSYFLTACNSKHNRAPQSKPRAWGRTTYNATTDAAQIVGAYERYHPKHLSDEVLVTFGYGDGGGGPTAHQLELNRRSAMAVPGSPRTTIEFAGDFLTRLKQRIEGNPDVPVWQGELYLEFHRGTYTTMAANKRDNRLCEFLYEDAELLSTVAGTLFGLPFPKERLHKSWEVILTNQFHDIIPGSSIRAVYERSARDYARLIADGREITEGVKERIAAALPKTGGYVVFNPHSFTGDGFVKVDGRTARVSGIAPKGYTLTDAFSFENRVRIDGRRVETDVLTVTFSESWELESVYDRVADREVLKAGEKGNVLRAHADYPDNYDAWEWQEYSTHEFRTLSRVSSVETVEDGARRGIRVTRPYGRSTVTQTVWFTDTDRRIDFETDVDWQEDHQMLKAVFPVDVQTDRATYEIQFGTIERPTHRNNSWDRAKFEVCGHKYADLSEGNYGVSLLNDSKYGYGITDGEMTLSLLRAPTDPNPVADRGLHHFTYALYLHDGTLKDADTAKVAYYLNYPMTALPASGDDARIPTAYSAVTVDSDHVVCETVKESEDGHDTVLRLYEYKNIRDKVRVTLGGKASRVFLSDLMENELAELPVENGAVTVPFRGFEIVTLKVR